MEVAPVFGPFYAGVAKALQEGITQFNDDATEAARLEQVALHRRAGLCWLCLDSHAVEDCPRYETARRSGNFPAHLARREQAAAVDTFAAIVTDLANTDTGSYGDDNCTCWFCHSWDDTHKPTCLWLRARRLTGRA